MEETYFSIFCGKLCTNLVRSKTIGVTGNGGRGTAGAGPGRDLLYGSILRAAFSCVGIS